MVDAHPGDGNAQKLRQYWLTGKGSLAIRWNTDGDFNRCVRQLREHAPTMTDPEGYCADLHHDATGMWPGDARNTHKVAAQANTDPDIKEGAVPSPQPSRADRIRQSYNATATESCWIVEVGEAEVIVIDDADRSLYRVPVAAAGDDFTFGDPVPVRMAYVPAGEPAVAASRVVFASRDESRPDVAASNDSADNDGEPPAPPPIEAATEPPDPDPDPTTEPPQTPPNPGGVSVPPAAEPEPTDPKEPDSMSTLSTDVRSRLGLTDDADDAATLAALDELKAKADTPTAPDPELVAASAATTAERDELRNEVKILASQMAQVTTELAATKAKEAATVKASVLDDAEKSGKFAPTDREQWETNYDEAPGAVTRILASIAPGTAVPVSLSGHAGTGDQVVTDVDTDLANGWAVQLGLSPEVLTNG
jgi:hypothetical protein